MVTCSHLEYWPHRASDHTPLWDLLVTYHTLLLKVFPPPKMTLFSFYLPLNLKLPACYLWLQIFPMILVELSHLWQKPMKSYEIYTLFLLCLLRREEEVPPKILVLPNSQEYLERWEHTICTWPGYVLSRKVMSTTCNPMDCSPPGSSVRGILQARILECAAMPSSRGSSQTRDETRVSMSPALAGGLFTTSASCVA